MAVSQIIGLVIFILGGIGLLIAAFRTSIFWGIGCIVFAPVALVFTLLHWADAKNPFLLQVFGFVILLISTYVSQPG